jgi:hypothetical protein
MNKPQPLFLIVRYAWTLRVWNDKATDLRRAWRDPTSKARDAIPVAAFAVRAAAQTRMEELELEAARLFNPFWVRVPFGYHTSLRETEFRRKLMVAAGPVPSAPLNGKKNDVWAQWWDENMPNWKDSKLKKIWALFDNIHFYTLEESELD